MIEPKRIQLPVLQSGKSIVVRMSIRDYIKREMSSMRDGEFLLSDADVDGFTFERIGEIGLYWKPAGNGNGFTFKALDWTCHVGEDPWKSPETTVENVVRGTAYFDGIRHIEFGNGGYANYPYVMDIANLFIRLRQLELENCLDAEVRNRDGEA